jgi:transposase
MKYFAGLDVFLKETAICVVDEQGGIVKEGRATSEPKALIAALQKVGLPLERVGPEACSLAAWLHTGLRQAGLPAICIETRQANTAMKTMTGWYREVHVKSRECRAWRSLLVARRTVLNEMRSIENVVRAILREAGIRLGTPPRTSFADRVRECAGGDKPVERVVAEALAIPRRHTVSDRCDVVRGIIRIAQVLHRCRSGIGNAARSVVRSKARASTTPLP